MRVLTSLLLAVGCLLAVPVIASASTYTVDSTGDQGDETVGFDSCETAVGSCTLRAAIEESNGSAGTRDTIVYAPSFDGHQADTIVLDSGLPPLTDSVHIDGDSGGQCKAGLGSMGPCVGVSGPIAGSAFTVEDDDVEIEGLSVAGVGGTAIDVINNSENFEARDNWIGVKLDGAAGTNGNGIFLGPGSDNATIGGINTADRNVIADSDLDALEIEGASSTLVQGNYFGVPPNGSGYIERNRENIEVTDSTAGSGSKAEDTEIGATIKGTALATAACDGGCNVISGATFAGIDLSGESGGDQAPASGPTTIHGNYIGMDSKGTAGVGAGHYAIDVRAASDVTVGGPHSGDTNYVTNCPFGIYQEGGNGFEARNNSIGLDITGTPAAFSAAYEVGILASSSGSSKPPLVLENTVRMTKTGVGIDVPLGGAEIIDNVVEAGGDGIATGSSSEPSEGSLIEGNLIEDSWDGISISNGDNDVVGNSIFDSREVGIYVLDWGPVARATGNVIGGDLPAEENTISGSENQAIRIVEELETEGGENEIARNNGAFNGARFIDLRGSANGEIQPPPFGIVTEMGASGSGAEAGAKIRVFRKATAETGELESFLAETTADDSGDWKVTYLAAIPKGTVVAATQTSVAGGTSELAIAEVPDPIVVDPIDEVDGSDGNGNVATGCLSVGCGPSDPASSLPTQTRIVRGPKARTRATTVTFRFSSSQAESSFECKLDRRPFEPCKSPQAYEKLKPGRHVFSVRAVDGSAADPMPARRKFRVLG